MKLARISCWYGMLDDHVASETTSLRVVWVDLSVRGFFHGEGGYATTPSPHVPREGNDSSCITRSSSPTNQSSAISRPRVSLDSGCPGVLHRSETPQTVSPALPLACLVRKISGLVSFRCTLFFFLPSRFSSPPSFSSHLFRSQDPMHTLVEKSQATCMAHAVSVTALMHTDTETNGPSTNSRRWAFGGRNL
ncbi:hypothetical protein VTO42DRAFT_7386 [Malbranchea cinnamomea]